MTTAELVTIGLALLAVIGAYTVSVAALALWLASRFRELEKLIYQEINKHKERVGDKVDDHEARISRLEVRAYGINLPQGLIPPK